MTVECKTVLQPELSELTFVKVKIPRCIPKQLIENVKGRTFTPEQFYRFQEGQSHNPNNYLFGLIDENKVIHGYLWAEKNFLDDSLFVNTFSITKDYWRKGEAIDIAIAFLRDLKVKSGAARVFWITTNDKFFAKKGFKKSRQVLMEFQDAESI